MTAPMPPDGGSPPASPPGGDPPTTDGGTAPPAPPPEVGPNIAYGGQAYGPTGAGTTEGTQGPGGPGYGPPPGSGGYGGPTVSPRSAAVPVFGAGGSMPPGYSAQSPYASPPKRARHRSGLIRAIVGIVILVLLLGGGAVIVKLEGKTTVGNLKAGQCIDGIHQGATAVRDVSCSKPHQAQIVGTLPKQTALAARIPDCKAELESFAPTALRSRLLLTGAVSIGNQSSGQLEHYLCVALDPTGADLTGSLKG